jgi:ATP-dependent Lhr-like helicase
MQRIGRASHQVGTISEGIIFPKFRGDLLACAAVTDAMHRGAIEPTRYPRNPLDVLAQQLVAMIAVEPWHADELFAFVRQAAPFSELARTSFDVVLDMPPASILR